EMDRKHVLRVEVAPVRLVAALRKKGNGIGKRAIVRRVERSAQGIDRRIENIEALEHQRRAAGEVFLDDAFVEKSDLGSLLDELARHCLRAVHFLALPVERDIT